MDSKPALGIDLGTTNCVVASVGNGGRAQALRTADGGTVTPTAVHFADHGVVVGREAREAAAYDATQVATFFKRDMGNANFCREFRGEPYDAEALSTLVLRHLRELAARELPELGPAIVTVPAYFHNSQREATIRAAREAGLEITQTINEPTAAALAYGQQHPELEGLIVVYDLGGGTFDATLLEYSRTTARVVASDGSHLLGGVLWDDRLITHVASRFTEEHDEDPLADPLAAGELRLRCEEAKKHLSSRQEVRIPVSLGRKRSVVTVTREAFEGFTSDLLDQTRVLLVRLLASAGVRWPSVHSMLLVGGSTRMPAVHTLARQLVRKEPLCDLNPDECVALGAAYEAAAGQAARLGLPPATRTTVDVTPHSLGYVAVSPDGSRFINQIILRKNTPIPVTQSQTAALKTRPGRSNRLDLFLLQGESSRVLDTELLGHYCVPDVPHSTGEALLEVAFQYDRSGVVQVTCREKRLGKELAVNVAQEEDLSWTELDPSTYQREQRPKVSVVLAIDTSGSMSGEGIREARRAAEEFLNHLEEGYRVGLVTFGEGGAHVRQKVTDRWEDVRRAVQQLSAAGGTPMTEGLEHAERLLHGEPETRVLVALTDGCPSNRAAALVVGARLKKAGVRIVAVGAGSADQEFLRRLASDPNASLQTTFADLANTFAGIARALGPTQSGLQRLS